MVRMPVERLFRSRRARPPVSPPGPALPRADGSTPAAKEAEA
jgi:hypothetical protein